MLKIREFRPEQETDYRLASVYASFETALLELGIKLENVEEIKEILNRLDVTLAVEEIIDNSFVPSQDRLTSFPVTRFSDGTFGVYSAALELATCKREVEFHVNREIVENESESLSFTRYYYLITCDYAGNIADLCGFWKKIC